MSEQNKDIIESIVEKISVNQLTDEVILFGSYALGTENNDSDIDLLIISNNVLNKKKLYSDIRLDLFDITIPIDLLVYTKKEFDEYSKIKNHILYDIKNYGKRIYERPLSRTN